MSKVVILNNPSDRPFGQLSNNAVYPMTIDNKLWQTVTNLIFSNLLTTPSYKISIQTMPILGDQKKGEFKDRLAKYIENIVKIAGFSNIINYTPYMDRADLNTLSKYVNTKLKTSKKTGVLENKKLSSTEVFDNYETILNDEDINEKSVPLIPIEVIDHYAKRLIEEDKTRSLNIYQTFQQYKNQENFFIIRTAIEKGYNAKFKNPDFVNSLLATNNSPIHYISHNSIVGVGLDGKGSNLIGKILMQIRHNKQKDKILTEIKSKKKVEEDFVYNIYLADSCLKASLLKNDNLESFIGLSIQKIIDNCPSDYLRFGSSKKTIMEMYSKGQLNSIIMGSINNPDMIVIENRKQGIRQIKERLENERENIIFQLYLDYMISKKYPELEQEKIENARIQQLNELSSEKIFDIKKRVISLFSLGMLSASLSDIIDISIKDLNIPTNEEIELIESAEIPIFLEKNILQPIEEEKPNSPVSDTSSSNSPDNQLKRYLRPDKNYNHKDLLIDQVANITGEDRGHFLKMSEEELELFIKEQIKNKPKQSWKKRIKNRHKNNLIDMITEITGKNADFYKDWDVQTLSRRLEALDSEKWDKPANEIIDQKVQGLFVPNSGKPIEIQPDPRDNLPQYAPFSPLEYTGMLDIDNNMYPTVSHFIRASLIAKTGLKIKTLDNPIQRRDIEGKTRGLDNILVKGIGIINARKYLFVNKESMGNKPTDFVDIAESDKRYSELEHDTTVKLMTIYNDIGQQTKFEDRVLQDLLLLTGESDIHYNDKNEPYLGIGTEKQPGYNLVGKNLVSIRDNLKDIRLHELPVIVRNDDISALLISNSFLRSWLEMRIKDMCTVVYSVKQFLTYKEKIEQNMNKQFVSTVLKIIYQPCSEIISRADYLEIEIPQYVIGLVAGCPGFKKNIAIDKTRIEEKINKESEKIKKTMERRTNLFKYGNEEINDISIETLKEFRKKQLDDFQIKRSILKNDPGISPTQMAKELENFKEEQKLEETQLKGITLIVRDKEQYDLDYAKYKSDIAGYLQLLKAFTKKVTGDADTFTENIISVSQLYWNYIVIMLSFLMKSSNQLLKIEGIIVNSEILNSRSKKCMKIIDSNEQDNCIVSAILNLLVGISVFNKTYLDKLTMLKPIDVKLAISIILTKDIGSVNIKQKNIEQKNIQPDILSQNNSSDISLTDGDFDGIGDGEDADYGDGGGMSSEEENEKSDDNENIGEFGITQDLSQNNLDKIKIKIREIDSTSDIDIMASTVMEAINIIKETPMSNRIKTNRINYFSTMR